MVLAYWWTPLLLTAQSATSADTKAIFIFFSSVSCAVWRPNSSGLVIFGMDSWSIYTCAGNCFQSPSWIVFSHKWHGKLIQQARLMGRLRLSDTIFSLCECECITWKIVKCTRVLKITRIHTSSNWINFKFSSSCWHVIHINQLNLFVVSFFC